METFTRTIAKRTRVTFKVCAEDLPKRYWDALVSDVTAVVSANPVHSRLTVSVCDADFIDAGTNLDESMGFTVRKKPTEIHINPRVFTREKEWQVKTRRQRGYTMPSAVKDFSRYVIAHEYGHSATLREHIPDNLMSDWFYDASGISETPTGISEYGASSPLEGIAEAYAEWFMTNGATRNEWVKTVARYLHFPANERV